MKILIIGCGQMGLCFLRAFSKFNVASPDNIFLMEKSEERKNKISGSLPGIFMDPSEVFADKDFVVLLCVKPQDFEGLKEMLAGKIHRDALVISIMAGISVAKIKQDLGVQFVIRAMPNAPSELGLGMTGFYADPSIPNNLLRKGENILGTIGRTMFFEEEELLNPVTALSGSGPAYFYYFLRSMIEAGKEMGVEEAKVSLLLKQTMLGAYHLLNHDRRSPEDLIAVVASRGGTTEAALRTFADEKVGEGIKKGLLAACRRAKELGS